TLATSSMEEISAGSSGPRWFQLYVYKDKAITEDLVRRAEKNGFSAIVFTVDAPLLGRRERDVRNRFCLPNHLEVKNLSGSLPANLPQSEDNSALFRYIANQCDASITWDYIGWLKSLTSLPVLVKGILRADDAVLAIENGASGIIVSNHGGRQLDTAPSTISALGPIIDAVGDRTEVFVDGGFRRGTDVLKALCMGARAVMLGRPVIWGLALAGQTGVERVLKLIKEELELSMALCGCASIDQIDRSLLEP
ncbi:MAG: alpha-hydroxy-acid oxidizing protein, partial [Cyanobacteria bacterium]|nr:alpha-hydroxy-acid oxidizing protein [Cyanobacteriota bacterium]